jgi:FkbM family methyltransferase
LWFSQYHLLVIVLLRHFSQSERKEINMLKLPLKLDKPEYFFRPTQLIQRLKQHLIQAPSGEFEKIRLPWGVDIRVRPSETIGSSIWRMGIYDLTVSEVIWRLLEQGEQAVDVGANIGYMTSLMAARVRKTGNVTSFEPHPAIFKELLCNVQDWTDVPNIAHVDAYKVGVSNQSGTGILGTSDDFEQNRGTASMLLENDSSTGKASHYEIPLIKLDDFLSNDVFTNLMKIDVEGYESLVLEGAANLLDAKRVRDIVFEDFGEYPTPVMLFLESKGYSLFGLGRSFLGPKLFAPSESHNLSLWEPPNYLATIDPDRATTRLKSQGWLVLR